MTPLESYLRDHAFTHAAAVAPAFPFNVDYLFADLSDRQLRARPHGFNSFAWLIWHLARTEDGCVGVLVLGNPQVLDQDRWFDRLGVESRGLGSGMSKVEVAELSETIRLPDLFEYRNAVGRRTRALVGELWPDRWNTTIDPADIDRAAAASVVSEAAAAAMHQYLPSQTREACLLWWGLHHSLVHLGQLMMLRGVLVGTEPTV
jgi:hypothetical protein